MQFTIASNGQIVLPALCGAVCDSEPASLSNERSARAGRFSGPSATTCSHSRLSTPPARLRAGQDWRCQIRRKVVATFSLQLAGSRSTC